MFEELTREELVTEYIETGIRELYRIPYNGDVVDFGSRGPVDLPKDPAYWSAKDKSRHDMHKEIAKRYHVSYDSIRWLDGTLDGFSDEMYIFDRKVKPLIRDIILRLEAVESGKPPWSVRREKSDDIG